MVKRIDFVMCKWRPDPKYFVDLDGRAVEVQSDVETNCLLVREILNLETKPATLRQSLDECIGVVR